MKNELVIFDPWLDLALFRVVRGELLELGPVHLGLVEGFSDGQRKIMNEKEGLEVTDDGTGDCGALRR